MDGFFSKDEIDDVRRERKIAGCGGCGLHKGCESPRMPPAGGGELGILFIAEAPGRKEDEENEPLIGPAGQLWRRIVNGLGIDPDRDCVKTNALICRPPKNRTPSGIEIEMCRPNLLKTIQEMKPKLIVPMGTCAVEALIGHRWPHGGLGGIGRWRGWAIPDRELGAWICPTYHPSFINRESTSDVAEVIFRDDLKQAIAHLDRPFRKWKDERSCVHFTFDPRHAYDILASMEDYPPKAIAIDYETTGLKPEAEGHEIVSVGIAVNKDEAIAFPLFDSIEEILGRILENPQIKKIAGNLKFESRWTQAILGKRIRGWAWDVVECSHVLDNRRGKINDVKFQTYVRLGLMDYSSAISEFLSSDDEKNGNAFNRIKEAPMKDLLVYNAIDALVEYRLALIQRRLIG